MRLVPITSYQGGKQRLAPQIVEFLLKEDADYYYDLCCGSGAISLELVNRGVEPSKITMIDSGPWGLIWDLIGRGLFPLKTLELYTKDIPKDRFKIKTYMEQLSKQNTRIDTAVIFLLLQAASFGSKPIWIKYPAHTWANTSFRSYWQPTATSNRRSPVNPMMPMPETLYERTKIICEKMKGVNGCHKSAEPNINNAYSCYFNKKTVIYIDPPYKGRTSYEQDFNAIAWAKRFSKNDNIKKCFVSESYKATSDAILLASSEDRKKGGISGNKKVTSNEEWLNIF